ncbi:MAG: hypothetical protein M1831_000252 [Alyxoria varia]|nr:MAG: hypothetical protein M1831_000252 [Alyxoria varia]
MPVQGSDRLSRTSSAETSSDESYEGNWTPSTSITDPPDTIDVPTPPDPPPPPTPPFEPGSAALEVSSQDVTELPAVRPGDVYHLGATYHPVDRSVLPDESLSQSDVDEINRLVSISNGLLAAVDDLDAKRARTLLSEGAHMSDSLIQLMISKDSLELLQVFHDYGLNLNKNRSRVEPPFLWYFADDAPIRDWLLAHGADPNAGIDPRNTVLSWAVLRSSFSSIRVLLENGGDAKKGQVLHALAMRECPSEERVEMLSFLIGLEAPLNEIEYFGRPPVWDCFPIVFGMGTPLHLAAQLGHADMVRVLLESGADYRALDSRSRMPIHAAMEKGKEECVRILEGYPI